MSYFEEMKRRDPAIESSIDLLLNYPGLHAVWMHKITHFMYRKLKLRTLAKVIMNITRLLTSVEIHPNATIGKRLFIDHGAAIVIGQMTIIGDNVHMYHGVTLGARGDELAGEKRHPTIENNVIIGANAMILGNITVKEGTIVKAGSIVIHKN